MDDALLRSQPAQLRIGRQPAPEAGEVSRDRFKALADDEMPEGVDRRHHHFVAAADGERQAVSLEPRVGLQHDVGGRVVGVHMDRVRPGVRSRRRKPKIEDVQFTDNHGKVKTKT